VKAARGLQNRMKKKSVLKLNKWQIISRNVKRNHILQKQRDTLPNELYSYIQTERKETAENSLCGMYGAVCVVSAQVKMVQYLAERGEISRR
jgi:hypothetical protein